MAVLSVFSDWRECGRFVITERRRLSLGIGVFCTQVLF